ncbi:MAG: MaoC/PaaZ C-terminal domain-containing protein [Amphritea sp.]
MSDLRIEFKQKPAVAGAMFKALLLPRKGFNAQAGLPDIQATWTGARVDRDALNEYLQTLGLAVEDSLLSVEDSLPVLYPHVMAGGMHMHMLTHKAFPIRLLGAVHLKNRITQHQAIKLNQSMNIHSAIGGYRLVEKGVEFDFSTTVTVDGEPLWQEVTTYFKAGSFGGKQLLSTEQSVEQGAEQSFELEKLQAPQETARWVVPANRGKKYAGITGDYNPIHMSSLAAKLFGFKRDIAHGFGILAEAIQHAGSISDENKKRQVDVVFKGPVYLESEVFLKQNKTQNESRFDVYCGNNPKPSICAAVYEI